MAKKKKTSRIGFATKQFWKAFRGYDAIKNTRYRANRGNDAIRSEEIELSNYDRDRLISASLELRRNNPVVTSMSRLRKADVVGKGIVPQANTGDDSLNSQIEDQWNEFSQDPEVTGQFDMRELQQQLVDSLLYYGDSGLIVLDGKVQFIDGSRIGNPNGQFTSSEKDTFQNGVEVNDLGQPINYSVGNRVNGNLKDYRMISAKDFIPFFKKIRPLQYRGVPELAPILNTLQDCDEYDRIEMISAKVAASLSVAVKRENSYEFELQNRLNSSEQDEIGGLENFEPGRFHYLEAGEDISVINSGGRPNVDGVEWVTYLLRKVGSAVGIPVEFLLMDIGGSSFSASQGVILQYQQTVESYQTDLIKVMQKLYRRWLTQKIAEDEIRIPTDIQNPFKVRWQRPAFRWVNRVAQVKADLDYFRTGAMSLDDITAPFGYTAEDVLIRKAQNITKAKQIAKEHNLSSYLDLMNAYNTSASANFVDLTSQEQFKQSKEIAQEEGAKDEISDPLITKIGVGGVQAISTLLDNYSQGGIDSNQLIAILTSIFGLSELEAKKIANIDNATS